MRFALTFLTFSGFIYSSAEAIRCLECSGVATESDCRAQGEVRQCQFNEDACEIELRRHEGWGGALKMYKHCKQSKACDDNYVQNPRSAWLPSQCNLDDFNSVCRCCCYTDECNVANENCFGGTGCGMLPIPISYGTTTCTNGRNYGSVCTSTCNPGRSMIGVPTTQCRFDGSWTYPLPRCADVFCMPKTLQYGWYTCTNGYNSGSECTPNCWPGYEPSGPKTIRCRNDGTWDNFWEPSCQSLQCPVRGPVIGGTIECSNGRNVQSRCKIVCDEGRRAIGVLDNYCQDNAEWSHELPTCEQMECPPRGGLMNGIVECVDGVAIGSECSATCNEGYAIDGIANSVCLTTGQWSEPLPRCIRIVCPPRGKLPGGSVFCTNAAFMGSICTASCAPGTQLVGSSESECLVTGAWSAPLPICQRIECPERGTVAGGQVRCNFRKFIGSVCSVSCSPGTRLVGPSVSECLESGEWSVPLSSCEDITCPPLDFSGEPGQMSCSNVNFYKSMCRFTCNAGFRLRGSPRLRCSRTGRWNTRMPTCSLIRCGPRGRLRNGDVDCSDSSNVGSICVATCDLGYAVVGRSDSVCQRNGRWSNRLPFCAPITCPRRDTLPGGTVTCTNDNFSGSVCTAVCGDRYELVGVSTSLCLSDGAWDVDLPRCELNPCPDQGVLEHGSISCTNDWNVASECTFRCEADGYELYPSARRRNVCRPNQRWTVPKPCCTRPCPPYAVMDIVVVLDSSSSVGVGNWRLLKDFVTTIIRSFIVSPDTANFAIFRYNAVVDEDTQILLKSYPGDIEGLITAFDLIPYNGRGTNTGNALRHALEVSLTEANGNRATAPDIVLVLTDGKARDDVEGPAKRLRDSGATVLVVGIEPPTGALDFDQLNIIAGDPRNVIIARDGFRGLDANFVSQLGDIICGEPCT